MFRVLAFGLSLVAATLVAAAAPRHPAMPLYAAAEIPVVCAAGLARARQAMRAIESRPVARARVTSVFHALNRMQIVVEDVQGPVDMLSNVSPDKAVRDAAEGCLLKFSEFETEWQQSEILYRRVLAVKVSNPVEQKLKKDLVDGFEDSGVALPRPARARMKEIIQKLEEARQEFDRNIRDNKTRLTFTPQEVRGMPAAYLARARRDDKGNYLLGFEYPEYYPFMTSANDEDARRRYQFGFTNSGTPRNMEILGQVAELRREMAGLFGMNSYAQFSLRRKMAGDPATVHRFLDDVKDQVREVAAKDAEALRALKAEGLGKPPAEVKINNWDLDYYLDKLRKARYNIDQEALREYFPTAAAIDWVLYISSVLYQIEFRPVSISTWHPEVRYYDVYDTGSGRFLGGLYMDLFPREGKYGHAANFGVRAASTLAHRTPYTVLVANLDRNGLESAELETLVHEFGHALHHLFARTAYVAQGGSSLEWDFVEAPSQMYEEWARRKESLQLLARFCTGCKPVDDDLVRRIDSARKVGMGLYYLRQHLLADYDIALYDSTPVDPLQTWIRMESETVLGHTPETLFPSSFSHIISGYAAGYYGYMWSEVLALDMLSSFGDNIMDPVVGRRFRDIILAHGGERPAARMVEEFLGRKPSNAAFVAEITGKRMSH